MGVGIVRPRIGQMVYRLFQRPVHPELVLTMQSLTLRRERYAVTLSIGECGHMLTLSQTTSTGDAGTTYCEVLVCDESDLPNTGQLISRRVRGSRSESLTLPGGPKYHVAYEVDRLEPEVFLQLQWELEADASRARLQHHFRTSSRLAPAPLSFVQIDDGLHALQAHWVHTFPDEFAILRAQSLFEWN